MQRREMPMLLVAGLIAGTNCSDAPLAPGSPALRPVADRQAWAVAPAFTASDLPVEVLDPGQIEFRDSRILWRGLVVRARIEASDPRYTGFEVATLNANWNLAGEGAVWGKATLENDGGGVWEGEWRARRTRVGESEWAGAATWSAQGRSGNVTGLHASGTETVSSFEAIPTYYVGERHGRITGPPMQVQP